MAFYSAIRNLCWTFAVLLLTAVLELWVIVALTPTGLATLGTTLVILNTLGLMIIVAFLCVFCKIVFYDKLWATDDISRKMCLGRDYWPPFPKWEWNQAPLQWNVCDYSTETGWNGIYPAKNASLKGKENTIENGFEDGGVVVLGPGKTMASEFNGYELHYFESATYQELPTMVVCICYLLERESNDFLFQSLRYFTQVHTAPIYVMINAKEKGKWIKTQLDEVSARLQRHGLNRQVKVFFVSSSRSKAANLNAFMDVLPIQDDNNCKYKYVMNYDIDDRPTYNETSVLKYAEGVVEKKLNGYNIVGVQGPCIECFNGTISGLFEAMQEFNDQTSAALGWDSRYYGAVRSQGSNHLVLTDVFCSNRFNENVLLEDWRWSNDIQQAENVALAYARTMVCYGQTPYGNSAASRRRKRWIKGRLEESLYDAFCRPCCGNTFITWSRAWSSLFYTFILQPLGLFLLLVGYGLVFAESNRHGRYGTLDPELLQESGIPRVLGVLWNFCWPLSLAAVAGIRLTHMVRDMSNLNASCFMNGRDTPLYKFGHILLHFGRAWSFIFGPLTPQYQFVYYCHAEYILEKIIHKKSEWVPTPKKADILMRISAVVWPRRSAAAGTPSSSTTNGGHAQTNSPDDESELSP